MKQVYHKPVIAEHAENKWQSKIPGKLIEQTEQVFQDLSGLLNGKHSIEDIWGKMILRFHEPEIILLLLETLDQEGLLSESLESDARVLSPNERVHYAPQLKMLLQLHQYRDFSSLSSWDKSGLPLQIRLKKASIHIIKDGENGRRLAESLSGIGIGQISQILESPERSNGIPNTHNSDLPDEQSIELKAQDPLDTFEQLIIQSPPGLIVYCPDQFNEIICGRINSICLTHKIPFIISKLEGYTAEIGPLVIPGQTACFECYNLRRKAALNNWEAGLPSVNQMGFINLPLGLDWLILDIVRFFTSVGEPLTRGTMQRINYLTGKSEIFPVLKLPRCPSCGVHKKVPGKKLWEET